MKFRKEPRNYERVIMDNRIIAYVPDVRDGIALVLADSGDLYYYDCPKEAAFIGDAISLEGLDRVADLPEETQIYLSLVKRQTREE